MTQTGEGLYEWKNGKPVKSGNGARGDAGMVDRLILPLLDACVDCLREGLVEGIDVLEGAVVFATGFEPFRGGPLHYAQTQGPADIVPAVEALAKQHGGRCKPDLGWSRLEKKP